MKVTYEKGRLEATLDSHDLLPDAQRLLGSGFFVDKACNWKLCFRAYTQTDCQRAVKITFINLDGREVIIKDITRS